jgi:hypothetical protein
MQAQISHFRAYSKHYTTQYLTFFCVVLPVTACCVLCVFSVPPALFSLMPGYSPLVCLCRVFVVFSPSPIGITGPTGKAGIAGVVGTLGPQGAGR